MIQYPRNYFDPYEDDQPAQCTICGEWFSDDNEIKDVVEVNELDGSRLFQGVCVGCKPEETE